MNDEQYNAFYRREDEPTDAECCAQYLETQIRDLKEKQYFYMRYNGIPKCRYCNGDLTKLTSGLRCFNSGCPDESKLNQDDDGLF